MEKIYRGNAQADGPDHRGWFVGSFMPDGDIRQNPDVELKWGAHQPGEERTEWVTGENRTTICLLISGTFTMHFRDGEETLSQAGDYVMWGPETDHRWRADEACSVLTIRWTPSQADTQQP